MKKTHRVLSIVLSIILILGIAPAVYAATQNYGTVTVNNRWSSDGSAKQVTVNCNGNGWTTADGITVTGTIKVTLPEGYYYGNPSAEEIWSYIAYGYTDQYGQNPPSQNQGQNQGRRGVVTLTAAQQEAEKAMTSVRDAAEGYGWATTFSPSTTTTATDDHCWYKFSSTYLRDDTKTRTYTYSVYTEKQADGTYKTLFKKFEYGRLVLELTPDEASADFVTYGGKKNTTPFYVVSVSKNQGSSTAASNMVTKLRNRGYSVSQSDSSYGTDRGTVTLKLSRSGYSTVTLVMTAERIGSSNDFRCTFAKNGEAFPIYDLLFLFD